MVGPYQILILAVALERLVELMLSRRNAAWAFARGGIEFGRDHYPVMVLLHTGLLVGAAVEGAGRPFNPMVGWPMLVLVLLAQGLRWWVILTLGFRWNTRVIVVPGLPLVRSGPFSWLRHPNYLAVVVEGVALPLVHGAWITALLFSISNGVLLHHRITVEDDALGRAERSPPT